MNPEIVLPCHLAPKKHGEVISRNRNSPWMAGILVLIFLSLHLIVPERKGSRGRLCSVRGDGQTAPIDQVYIVLHDLLGHFTSPGGEMLHTKTSHLRSKSQTLR